jgi:hypothetical protein
MIRRPHEGSQRQARSATVRSKVAAATAEVSLPAEELWRLARRTATQLYLSGGVFRYAGTLPAIREQRYEGENRVLLFGSIPAWKHWQRFECVDDRDLHMLVRERGGPYRVWNHEMRVEAIGRRRSRFLDSIEVEAGPLTPVVWAGAAILCHSRMRRLRELARVLA